MGQNGNELKTHLPFFLGQPAGLPLQDEVPGRLAHGAAQFLRRKRLGQEIVGAAARGGHGRIQRSIGRDHDDQEVERAFAEPVQDVQPGRIRQLVIEKENVGRPFIHLLFQFLAGGRRPDVESDLAR